MKLSADYCEGFAPIVSDNPTWMILGTMPSKQSLQSQFYYAHPRNAFWRIMQAITDYQVNTEADKKALVKHSKLLLWDVLQSCDRPGSLDSAIKEPVANDFESLLLEYPAIKTIVFNGKKAQQLFVRYVEKKQKLPVGIHYMALPSTSPANATMKVKDKQLFWQEKLSHLV